MISWWWLIVIFIVGLFCGYNSGYYYAFTRCYEILSNLKLNPQDIQLSEAKLEVLWLSKTLENIATYPNATCSNFCKAERWREDANKWAKKTIVERIKEKVNE